MKSLIISLILFFASTGAALAQAPWEMCTDGSLITRCITYDCPAGDTNGDRACGEGDNQAKITDSRSDSFCSNPPSGCGQVYYYNASSSNSCSVRVKQDPANCSLYDPLNPNFTPVPSVGPTASPGATASPVPSGAAACLALKGEPTKGSAPLDVRLTATGNQQGLIYEFTFGDGGNPLRQNNNVIVHKYEEPGVYNARVRVAGSDGVFRASDACSVVISSSAIGGTTKGGVPVDELPSTGSPFLALLGIIGVGGVGVYIYERYKFA